MDEKNQDKVKDNMKKRTDDPYKELDWKKEPPRFGTSHGPGPRSPMKPRRDTSPFGGSGPNGPGPIRNSGNP